MQSSNMVDVHSTHQNLAFDGKDALPLAFYLPTLSGPMRERNLYTVEPSATVSPHQSLSGICSIYILLFERVAVAVTVFREQPISPVQLLHRFITLWLRFSRVGVMLKSLLPIGPFDILQRSCLSQAQQSPCPIDFIKVSHGLYYSPFDSAQTLR